MRGPEQKEQMLSPNYKNSGISAQVMQRMEELQTIVHRKDDQIKALTMKLEYAYKDGNKIKSGSINPTELLRENSELKNEIRGLKRVQNAQGKALSKMTEETDFEDRIANLEHEVVCKKEQIREMNAKMVRE